MEIKHTNTIVDKGEFSDSTEWKESRKQIIKSIKEITWPKQNSEFIIYPEEEASGVNPITDQFESNLDLKEGWKSTGRKHFKTVLETLEILESTLDNIEGYYEEPEDIVSSQWFDGAKLVNRDDRNHILAVEWETGNISSSHRSLNRLTLGLVMGIISAGVIIIPTKNLAQYLTDRVGNYPEIEPYFLIWELLESEIEDGLIEVIAVEHDETGDVPPLGKMTDGMSDREESEVDKPNDKNGNQSGLSNY